MEVFTSCVRCAGTSLVTASLEQGMTFCMDHDCHHGVRRLGMEAVICQACGHTEFRVKDPARALPAQSVRHPLQEEDF